MRNLRFVAAALALVAVAPAAAHAQYAGKMKWAGVGSSFVATYRQSNNTNISVYGGAAYRAQFQINSSNPWLPPHGTTNFGPAVDIYCVDFTHHANTSSSGYDVWFTKLSTSAMTKTRSSNANAYLKAAWLITKMETYSTTTAAGQSARSDIHAAIWYMMSGNPVSVKHGSTFSNAGMNSWIAQANANWTDGSVHAGDWTVVTDVCVANSGHAGQGFGVSDNCSQEFLTRNVVPEPATMILLGTGLLATLAMTGVLRRPEA